MLIDRAASRNASGASGSCRRSADQLRVQGDHVLRDRARIDREHPQAEPNERARGRRRLAGRARPPRRAGERRRRRRTPRRADVADRPCARGKTVEVRTRPLIRAGSTAASRRDTNPPIELPARTTGPSVVASRNRESQCRSRMSVVPRPRRGDRPNPGRSGARTRPRPGEPGRHLQPAEVRAAETVHEHERDAGGARPSFGTQPSPRCRRSRAAADRVSPGQPTVGAGCPRRRVFCTACEALHKTFTCPELYFSRGPPLP